MQFREFVAGVMSAAFALAVLSDMKLQLTWLLGLSVYVGCSACILCNALRLSKGPSENFQNKHRSLRDRRGPPSTANPSDVEP